VDKRRLLGGEMAVPVPDPGALKSEQQSRPAAAPPARRVAAEPRPQPARQSVVAAPAARPAEPPAPPRQSVEVIEGGKRRSVDFP
jgi:hypothetical protein